MIHEVSKKEFLKQVFRAGLQFSRDPPLPGDRPSAPGSSRSTGVVKSPDHQGCTSSTRLEWHAGPGLPAQRRAGQSLRLQNPADCLGLGSIDHW